MKILEKKVGLFQNLHTEECGKTIEHPEKKKVTQVFVKTGLDMYIYK